MIKLKSEHELLLERLWERTIVNELGCWLYEATNTRGHGQLRWHDRMYGVHRLSAHIHLGMSLNSDEQVNHEVGCPNRNCWNPKHIYLGNQSDNIKDTIKAGTYNNQNTIKTHCKNGHHLPEPDDKGHRRCKICIDEYQKNYRQTFRNKHKTQ